MKDIIGFENYAVDEYGNVYSKKKNLALKPLNNGNGYLKVNLYKDAKLTQQYIHRLVAEAFIDNPNNYKYVDHIDRNKTNNKVENLRWVSAKENTDNLAGKPRYSVSKEGQGRHDSLTIQNIREDYKAGATVMELARQYNIPRQSISRFIKELC